MIGGTIDEMDRRAGPLEIGSHRAADGAGAPDQDGRGRHPQFDSIIVRVSSTATFHSAIISVSLRS